MAPHVVCKRHLSAPMTPQSKRHRVTQGKCSVAIYRIGFQRRFDAKKNAGDLFHRTLAITPSDLDRLFASSNASPGGDSQAKTTTDTKLRAASKSFFADVLYTSPHRHWHRPTGVGKREHRGGRSQQRRSKSSSGFSCALFFVLINSESGVLHPATPPVTGSGGPRSSAARVGSLIHSRVNGI